jgi:hypothetical protein
MNWFSENKQTLERQLKSMIDENVLNIIIRVQAGEN